MEYFVGDSTEKNVFKIQKKALRVVFKTKYNSHTDPLFKSNNLLKVNDIFRVVCVKFFYNYEKERVPTYFRNIFNVTNISHSYNTRNRNQNNRAIPNKQTTRKTIRYVIPQIINEIPPDIKTKIYTHSLENVKDRLKTSYIDEYQLTCTKRHCYVCQT